tara:strand:+ start:140 stop:484 length:345 start_codon:yes stop_codon:yes gene_type:complete
MSNSVTMKRNDTRPFLDVILQDVDGNALDLSATVSGVTFTMKDLDSDSTKVQAQACTVIPETTGMVRYSWSAGDTNTAGTFVGEFQIQYNDGTQLTIPTSSVLSIVVLEDYDNA